MDASLRVQGKPKVFSETGSVFDATDLAKVKGRAGSHENVPTRAGDISAFSLSKRTSKPDPHNYTKKYTGTGGTLQAKPSVSLSEPEAAQLAQSSKQSKINVFPAFAARPNPPSSELRRYAPTSLLLLLHLHFAFKRIYKKTICETI